MSRGTVFTEAVDGGDRIWLDHLGLVAGLTHQTTYPGGDSQASWQMNLTPDAQHRAWNYGRRVGLCLAAIGIWHGNMDNPTRGSTWQMTAFGTPVQTAQRVAIADISGNALALDEVIDAAAGRGAPFTRAGALPTMPSDQPTAPSATMKLNAVLDQVAAAQAAETYWQISTDGVLSMGPAPTVPTYTLLATSSGGGRTLDGFATDAFVTYQSASGVISVAHREAATKPYGTFEEPVDKTALGLIPSTQADALGDGYLARNGARTKFTNAFTVTRGQLLTPGGVTVDLATVRAGFLANVILTDPDSAGEVLGTIPQVLIGATSYDWDADILTLTPVYAAQDNLPALLGAGSGLVLT